MRRGGWRIVEGTAAATLAWVFAVQVLGHQAPFFAPAAALIAMGVARGQRIQRALEVVVGVAIGVLAADLLARALAPRLTLAILLITGLTLTVATVLDGGPILSVQAAVSGIYVAVVAAPAGGLIPSRFVDALVGGGVALAVNALPMPRSLPERLLRGAAPAFSQIAATLEAVAAALAGHDQNAARAALERARGLDAVVAEFQNLAAAEAETVRFDPVRGRRSVLAGYERAARQLDLTVRNVRVLARAGLYLTRSGRPAPASLAPAVATLAVAVRELGVVLAAERPGDVAGQVDPVAHSALHAVRCAASALAESPNVPVVMIVGQVRATAVDLMLGTGAALSDVLAAADEALGEQHPLRP